MQSDILIYLKAPVDESGSKEVIAAIYKATNTATVSFKPTPGKIFLVKFDPEVDTPSAILNAVHTVHKDAVMAGG